MRTTSILTLAAIATTALFAPSANAETYSEHYAQAILRDVTAMESPLEIETRKGFWQKMEEYAHQFKGSAEMQQKLMDAGELKLKEDGVW